MQHACSAQLKTWCHRFRTPLISHITNVILRPHTQTKILKPSRDMKKWVVLSCVESHSEHLFIRFTNLAIVLTLVHYRYPYCLAEDKCAERLFLNPYRNWASDFTKQIWNVNVNLHPMNFISNKHVYSSLHVPEFSALFRLQFCAFLPFHVSPCHFATSHPRNLSFSVAGPHLVVFRLSHRNSVPN